MSAFFSRLLDNYEMTAAILLFAIGFCTLLFHRNLVKKIIGMGIMDTGVYLLLTSLGYIAGRKPPILTDHTDAALRSVDPAAYVNPVPAGLVLTGIVVSVSVTAVMLALTVRLYKHYGTLDLDEIYTAAKREVRLAEEEDA